MNKKLYTRPGTIALIVSLTAFVGSASAADSIHKCKDKYSNVNEYRNTECDRETEKARLKLPPITKYDSDRIFENSGIEEETLLNDRDASLSLKQESREPIKTNPVDETKATDLSLQELIDEANRYHRQGEVTVEKSKLIELQVALSKECMNVTPDDGINVKEECQKAIHKLKTLVHQ